jgi:uncharacterized repeat protein (TIGR03803 family)
MRKSFLHLIPALIASTGILALIGCGSGSVVSGTSAYTVSGTVAGLAAGESVSVQDNGQDTLALSANGAFSFPVNMDTGAAYAITVQSHTPGIACSVANGSGTVGSSNVTGIGISCAAGTQSVLYSFGATATDGLNPGAAQLTVNAGNFYGTTEKGGENGYGAVYKITAAGTESVLYSFGATASDGAGPVGGLIVDSAGNLYGTTVGGGANDRGTVYKITAAGTESVLYSFGATASDGVMPYESLIMDSAGNLYGTTVQGGAKHHGTVFKISAAGTESLLHSFGATASDGWTPLTSLIMDSAGNLYGTTTSGGANDHGTVFKIGAAGTESVLYSFGATASDGQQPYAGLLADSAGNLYGTTYIGGANNRGTVFKISAAGTESLLYSFGATASDGVGPYADLITDSAGNLYGTTEQGGANDKGTVFKISAAGTESVLYSFGATGTDGATPYASLIVDSAGNLYGTTNGGGANGNGTVFKID